MNEHYTIRLSVFALLLMAASQLSFAQNQYDYSVEQVPGFNEFVDYSLWDFVNIGALDASLPGDRMRALQALELGYRYTADSFSGQNSVYYYQNRQAISVSGGHEQMLYFRLGETTSLYLVVESFASEVDFLIDVIQLKMDGSEEYITGGQLRSGSLLYANVLEGTSIAVRVRQDTPEGEHGRQLWLTIVPDLEVLPFINSAIHATPLDLSQ